MSWILCLFNSVILQFQSRNGILYIYPTVWKQLWFPCAKYPNRRLFEADFYQNLLWAQSFQARLRSSRVKTDLNTDMITEHLSTVGRPINSALIVMVRTIVFAFQIIEAACQQRLITWLEWRIQKHGMPVVYLQYGKKIITFVKAATKIK